MNKKTRKQQRKIRISSAVRGTTDRPRLSVFRSNRGIYAQIIDDAQRKTLLGASIVHVKDTIGTKSEIAKKLGALLAQKAKEQKITKVVFDKGTYKYHGRVKSFAEGVREGGLSF